MKSRPLDFSNPLRFWNSARDNKPSMTVPA